MSFDTIYWYINPYICLPEPFSCHGSCLLKHLRRSPPGYYWAKRLGGKVFRIYRVDRYPTDLDIVRFALNSNGYYAMMQKDTSDKYIHACHHLRGHMKNCVGKGRFHQNQQIEKLREKGADSTFSSPGQVLGVVARGVITFPLTSSVPGRPI